MLGQLTRMIPSLSVESVRPPPPTWPSSPPRPPGVRFDGVTGYPAPETAAEIRDRDRLGHTYAWQLVAAAEAIRARGIPVPVVAMGGTATAAGASGVDGVTELCAGAYATYDGGLVEVGVCETDQLAVTIDAGAADLLAGCIQP